MQQEEYDFNFIRAGLCISGVYATEKVYFRCIWKSRCESAVDWLCENL